MADGSVTERRLRPIQDAITANNWKQALKECDKWQKKGEKSEKFYALKAYVLVNQADRAQIDKGQSETLQLCARNPAITDFDTINILQDALRDLSLEAQEGPKLWERAATARPGDKAILMTWLNRALEDSQWQFAQKAAMALRKAFPNERNYDFWNILLCFLVQRDERTSDKERLLFGTLAYRLISKAAESIPTTMEGVVHPGKGVTKPEEIALLVQIYLATSHCKEAVDLLTGPTLSLKSSAAAGLQDPQLMMSLLLQCLSVPTDDETKFKTCRFVLGYPNARSDDRVWSALQQLYQSGDDQIKAQVAKLMDEKLPSDEIRHRSFLARQDNTPSDAAQVNNLLFCKDAFARAGTKPHIFKDLRENLQALDQQEIKDFLSSLDHSSQFSQIFVLKISRLTSPIVREVLLLHSSRALSIYRASLASGNLAPECSILAALTLVQLSKSTNSRTPLLRATAILELCRVKHEDYFPISILLINLYRYLGLFSLAFSTFVSLSVKNLQWETVGHLVLTRVGTLHPHRPKDEVSESGKMEAAFEPAGALDGTLQVGNKIVDGIGESIKRGLREGAYQNVVSAVETKGKIERSLWRRICAIEEQKVARMTGDSSIEPWQAQAESTGGQVLSDQRDTAFRPYFSDADTAAWALLDCGPVPKEGWLHAMVLQERLRSYFRSTADKEAADKEWEALKAAQKSAQESLLENSGTDSQLTESEKALYQAMTHVLKLVEATKGGEASVDGTIASIEKALGEWTKIPKHEEISDEMGVGWNHLHHWYVGLELGHLVSAFVSWAEHYGVTSAAASKGKKGKGPSASASKPVSSIPEEKLQGLRDVAEQLQSEIHEQVKGVKSQFTEGGVLGKVLERVMPSPADEKTSDEGFGEAFNAFVEDMGGEAAVETNVGRWLASWEDSCDGVLAVKSAGGSGRKGK